MNPFSGLSSEHWFAALLSFVPSLLNLGVLFYIFRRRERNATVLVFIMALMALFILQIQETLLRLCTDESTARFWLNFFGLLANMVTPLALHFVYLFIDINKYKRAYVMMLVFYVPTVLLGAIQVALPGSEQMIYNEEWGWSHIPGDTFGNINALWLSVLALAIPARLIMFAIRIKKTDTIKYKQTLLMIIGTFIPVFLGVVYEILMPVLINTHPVPITSALTLIFVICIFIALTRYRMLEFTPESMWPSIIQHINDGILIVDNSGIIQYANQKFCSMTGYSGTELIGKNASAILLTNEAQKEQMTRMNTRRQKMISDVYELEGVTKSGKKIWWEIRGIPYVDEEGNVTGSIGLHTDITEKKRLESELIYSDSIKNSILKNLDKEVIFSRDLFTEKLIYISPGVEKLLGISVSEFMSNPEAILKVIHPDDIQKFIADRHKARGGQSLSHEFRIILHDNSVKWIRANLICEKDREVPVRLDGSLIDVTEYKKLANDLIQQKEVFSNIFHSLDKETFWSRDLIANKVLYVSPGVETLFQRNLSEFLRDDNFFLNHIHKDDFQRVKGSLEDSRKGMPQELEFRIVMPDESVKWVKANVITIFENGKAVRNDGSLYDITELKFLHEQLSEKIKDMNMFIYRASHDLRGPLSSILGLANIGKLESKGDPRIDFYFDKIVFSINRLDDIIKELSQIGRIIQVAVHLEKVDLSKEVLEVIDSLKGLENHSKVKFNLAIETPFINTDKGFLIMALQNLIANSIHYMDPHKPDPVVNIRCFEQDGKTRITISDNGVGIVKEVQSKVFDMFYRGSDLSKGSGLGLYIVKHTVQKLGGTICLDSEAEIGTTLSMQLPKNQTIDLKTVSP